MTRDELVAFFEEHDDEFLRFDRVQAPRSKRPDLHAFLVLDEMLPGTKDMVACAEHDEIWLDVDLESFAEKVSREVAIDLIRCGVRIDEDTDSLAMFV